MFVWLKEDKIILQKHQEGEEMCIIVDRLSCDSQNLS